MVGLENPLHLALLLVVLLLVFGAKRLPEMGRSLGSGLRGFKDALSSDHSEELALPPADTTAAPRQPTTAAQTASRT